MYPEESWFPSRQAVLASGSMAAACHPAVSSVGSRILADGANAIDATLAMAAMCWMTLPGQCGIGGDAFAIVREPDGRVWTVGGSGFGPDGGEPEFYAAQGLARLPVEGALAVAVPGALAGVAALQQYSGTRELSELWHPAIIAAERGVPCTSKTREDIAEHRHALAADNGTRRMFLPGGQIPELGQRLRYPELANSMRTLAADLRSFYHGEIADRAVTTLRERGAPFEGEEWQLGETALTAPSITRTYGTLTVHQIPPPSPGWMLLQQAGLCDGELPGRDWLRAEAVECLAGAARRAFHDRWWTSSDSEAWQETLTASSLAAARTDLAARRRPLTAAGIHPDGDTTSTLAIDAEGRAVSFIHSLAFTFGARISVPGTGIVLNNRLGRGAYLINEHPNQVRPRRRPLHTLNAWIGTDERGTVRHMGNTPGGDGQVQWNMQLLSHLVDYGLDPQRAVSAPRFTVYPGSDADTIGHAYELRCESRLGAATLRELIALGHRVRDVGPWGAGGSALVVSVDDERGCLVGGADPRQDGVVLGE